MKFASYHLDGIPSFGVVRGETVVDLSRSFAMSGGTPIANDLLGVVQGGDVALDAVRAALKAANEFSRAIIPIADVRLLPPLPRPTKIICVARNYAEHAKEAGLELPTLPILFARFPNTLAAEGQPVAVPSISNQLDWEGELAVVIGRDTKGRIRPEEAMDYIFGYSIFNDITVRDYQFRVPQYTAGKNFRTSGPFGPVLVTAEEVGDPHALEITTKLNGKIEQQASTATMIFDIPTILAHIAEFVDLEAGDVIATGTPAGVGFKRQPPLFMKAGDTIAVSIDKIGTLTNPIVSETLPQDSPRRLADFVKQEP